MADRHALIDVKRLMRHRETSVVGLLVLVLVFVGAVNHTFVSLGNLRDMLVNSVPTIMVACGLTLVVVMGEIDISMGSTVGLCGAVMGAFTAAAHPGIPTSFILLLVLALGSLVGLVNGILVAYGRVPSIIVTLGMLTLLGGIKLVVLNGQQFNNLPHSVRWLGTASFLHVPISIIAAVVVFAGLSLVARSTPLGLRIYACGSNPDAAKLGGLRVQRLKLLVFVITGFLAALAAIFECGHLGVVGSTLGQDFELAVVTSVVVGGSAISGGRGSIFGSVAAAILIGTIGPTLIFMKLGESATYWEQAIQGAFILVAVLTDHYRRRSSQHGAHM